MAFNSRIEWCDSSENLEMGCDGCEVGEQCYAKQLTDRFKGKPGWPAAFDKPELFPERLPEVLHWPDLTGQPREDKPWLNGLPRLIFLNDMGDTFTESLPLDWLAPFLPEMAGSPHRWLVLTKRPKRMLEFFRQHPVPANFWLGTSVTAAANVSRIEELVKIEKAPVLFLSVEPLLEEVSIQHWLPHLQWVIAGGESTAEGMPAHPDWFRVLRDECQEARVPFFFKQWGEWAPFDQVPRTDLALQRLLLNRPPRQFPPRREGQKSQLVYRFGNDAAGSSLDGRAWQQMPQERLY